MSDQDYADAMQAANDVLQAAERLHSSLKNLRPTTPKRNDPNLKNVLAVCDSLRETKSDLEGTSIDFMKVEVQNGAELLRLHQMILMHLPSSLTNVVRKEMADIVRNIFQGTVRKVLYCALITCPWYSATQSERGQKAKRNSLLVVYQSHPHQFLAPVNHKIKERDSESVDLDWLYAVEAQFFARYLIRGKSRLIEALNVGSVIHEDDSFVRLKSRLCSLEVTQLQGFVDQTLGQAFGLVGHKSKDGRLTLREKVVLQDFCSSFRLLWYCDLVLSGQAFHIDELRDVDSSSMAGQALSLLTTAYQQHRSGLMPEMLDVVIKWKQSLDKLRKKMKFASVVEIERCIGDFLVDIRTAEFSILPDCALTPENQLKVERLLGQAGSEAVRGMPASDILLIAQAGSHLYGLKTPDSDIDYVIIYRTPLKTILGTCRTLTESSECRGPEKSVEFGTYEARLLTEMLWKCSVVMLELVFADDLEYVSPLWKVLQDNKSVFVTEKAIVQYMGLIKNNMALIENKKHSGKPRERKIFYQIFHKLHCLDFFLRGDPPQVKCTGDFREWIMRIRRGPLEGDISAENLHSKAKEKIKEFKRNMLSRKKRLPENVSYGFLYEWTLKIRQWPAHYDSSK